MNSKKILAIAVVGATGFLGTLTYLWYAGHWWEALVIFVGFQLIIFADFQRQLLREEEEKDRAKEVRG
jgi:hypothetical protein